MLCLYLAGKKHYPEEKPLHETIKCENETYCTTHGIYMLEALSLRDRERYVEGKKRPVHEPDNGVGSNPGPDEGQKPHHAGEILGN